jgi:hypothetical protein
MKYSIQYTHVVFFLLLCFPLFSQGNEAESNDNNIENKHPLLTDKFIFNVGPYSSFKQIQVGANGSSKDNIIDFSRKFDFDDNEYTLFLGFYWRVARMWSISTETFGVKNANSVILDSDIEWDDVVYNAGLEVKAGFSLRMYRILFGRTITKGLRHEFGAGLGVHALDIESFIEGEVFINKLELSFERRSVSAVAPLPNVGVWYFYAPNNKWMFTARVDWFGITVGDYSGNMWNLGPGVNYQFHKNIGIGLKYRYFESTLRVDKTNWDGRVSLIYHGPLITVNANF